jgi:tRNA-2-methylthio-N6-dimethylallyladenosine synthase
MKHYFIETFGCQMNKNDSELMSLSLQSSGFFPAKDRDSADIVVINTCSVRDAAEKRAFSHLRESRGRHRKAIIVLAGCMAQRTGDTHVVNKIANIVIGPYETPRIGQIINEYLADKKTFLHLSQQIADFSPRITDSLALHQTDQPWHRFVTITHGCENFCTYCIVPYVRGKLISFSSETIVDYTGKLVDQGVIAVTLLGQNVNQYGLDSKEIPFHELLEKVASIKGLERVSFLTSHPKDFHQEIISVIKDNPVISRGVHLPLQSGSDSILGRMNRAYTASHYMSIVENLERAFGSGFSLTTDLIVGFPGETEEDYLSTISVVEKVRFSEAFTYAYSPREGTKAFDFIDDIPREIKTERLNNLIKIQRDIVEKRLKERIGTADRVIIERKSTRADNDFFGKTDLDRPVIVRGNNITAGSVVAVNISGTRGAMLVGDAIQ